MDLICNHDEDDIITVAFTIDEVKRFNTYINMIEGIGYTDDISLEFNLFHSKYVVLIKKFCKSISSLSENEIKTMMFYPGEKVEFLRELELAELLQLFQCCNYFDFKEMQATTGRLIASKTKDMKVEDIAKIVDVHYDSKSKEREEIKSKFGRYDGLIY